MIESIKIKVGDKTIELTLDEAVQLKKELQDLFDRGFVEMIVPPPPFRRPDDYPFRYGPYPVTCEPPTSACPGTSISGDPDCIVGTTTCG